MKTLLFIGHEFHKKTKSSDFLQTILAESYNIETLYINPDIPYSFSNFSGKKYNTVILWQVMPSLKEMKKYIDFEHCAFFPMYDNTKTLNSPLWNEYTDCNIINFSKTFHETCKKGGLSSYYIQYFPKPANIIDEGDENSIFFWQRRENITTKTLEKVLEPETLNKLYLHKSTDPKNRFINPSKSWKDKVVCSSWFETNDEMQEYIQKSALYFAPRKYEGIGMSFLEAMASGRCVIAPDYPTMNEYITNGVTGYLYNLKKPKRITLKDIRKIQQNSFEFIKKGYENWNKEKHNILKYIESEPVIDRDLLNKTLFLKREKVLLFGFIPAKIYETGTKITYKLFYFLNITKTKKVKA